MSTPRVSVIMPAYRCAGTISESIRSVQAQTLFDWELLIVDDGNRDDTPAVIDSFAKADPRIRVICLPDNGGVANARNVGVRAAVAEWIAFLDSDDMWLPDKLERQLALAKETGAPLLYTGAACIDEHSEKTGREFKVPASTAYRSQLYGNDIVCSTVLMRRELFLRHPMERSDLHEDYLCWLAALQEGFTAYGIPEPLILYRLSAGSKSGNKLHSAVMTWRTYKHLGFGLAKRLLFFTGYAVHGIRRYRL